MFNKSLIPSQDPQVSSFLTSQLSNSQVSPDSKSAIDRKLEKIDRTIAEKIKQTQTTSEYFEELWKNPDIKDSDKNHVILKLESIQLSNKSQIKAGDLPVAKTAASADNLNTAFKMTSFEEFTLQEKIKELKAKNKIDETSVLARLQPDLDILHALNRPFVSSQAEIQSEGLHYNAGLADPEEDETVKQAKAEAFISKIKEDKKAYDKKKKQREQSVENRELQELERQLQKEKEDEEARQAEKKRRLEANIQELKARSDLRVKENAKWEEDYKTYRYKKPLFKEIEDKFSKAVLMPELEERKKRLQEIRDFHKPINRAELIEHEQKVLRVLEEQGHKKRDLSEEKWVYKKPDYESRHHKVFADEISKTRKQKEETYIERLKKKEKVIELMKEVKDKHFPKVDPQKELEMMAIMEKLNNRNKRKDLRSKTADEDERSLDYNNHSRKLGDDYLRSVRNLVKKKRDQLPQNQSQTPTEARSRLELMPITERVAERKKETQTSMKSDQPQVVVKKKNYLAELRKENKIATGVSQVEAIIKKKDMEPLQRKELLQSEIEKLEAKAKRKELVRKVKNQKKSLDDVDDNDEVDQIYINAIRAKLEMLGS